jgi:hypothetical protein
VLNNFEVIKNMNKEQILAKLKARHEEDKDYHYNTDYFYHVAHFFATFYNL